MPSVGTFPRDLDTQAKGSFKNYVDKFLAFLTFADSFYLIKVDILGLSTHLFL